MRLNASVYVQDCLGQLCRDGNSKLVTSVAGWGGVCFGFCLFAWLALFVVCLRGKKATWIRENHYLFTLIFRWEKLYLRGNVKGFFFLLKTYSDSKI